MMERLSVSEQLRTKRITQKVVVVNGTQAVFDLLESVLDAGHYDVVFVADVDHAYSQVKQNRPDLIVVCVGLDDPVGFQVLSMLKLDRETRRIPILTCSKEFEVGDVTEEPEAEEAEDEMPLARRALPLN
jgi:PleD family two-component response regulator